MDLLHRLLMTVLGLSLMGFALVNGYTLLKSLMVVFDPVLMVVHVTYTLGFIAIGLIAVWIGLE